MWEKMIRTVSPTERSGVFLYFSTQSRNNCLIYAVAAYGRYDRVQPFKASLRLKAALEENRVDFKYIEFPHSDHGLQNDNALSRQWMEAIEEYLDKYMPVR